MTGGRASGRSSGSTNTAAAGRRPAEANGGPRPPRQRRSEKPANNGLEATETLLHLHRAANAVRHHVEQAVLRPQNLTWTGFVVLRTVWTAGKIETRHAAEEAGISKATLTGVVDTLVTRGLVRRAGHTGDGRLVVLEVTRKGQRLLRQLVPAARDEEEFALSCLAPATLGEVSTALRQLIAHLDRDTARERR